MLTRLDFSNATGFLQLLAKLLTGTALLLIFFTVGPVVGYLPSSPLPLLFQNGWTTTLLAFLAAAAWFAYAMTTDDREWQEGMKLSMYLFLFAGCLVVANSAFG